MRVLVACSLFVVLFSLAVDAGNLIVTVPDDGENILRPVDWEYRSQTTRSWIPGCTWYDVLQGSGFFPATWYYTYTPEQDINDSNSYIFETDSGFWRDLCGAKLDEYNHLRLEYTNAINGTFKGSFRVIPGGSKVEETVNCWIDSEKESYKKLQCNNPIVHWDNEGTTKLTVAMVTS